MQYLCNMINIFVASMPMLVCLFWSAILLLDWWEQRTKAKARMFVYMTAAAVLYIGHFFFFGHLYELIPVTDTLYCMANLAVFPLYYIYIKEVTEAEWRRHWQVTLLLPALLAGLVTGTLYFLMDNQQTRTFIDTYLYQNTIEGLNGLPLAQAIAHVSFKFIFALQIPFVLVKGLQKIKRFDKMVEANYADVGLRKMYMAKTILLLLVVASVISFTANILGRGCFDHAHWLVFFPSATFSTLLFFLGYAGHRQNFTIHELTLENTNVNLPSEPIAEPQSTEENKSTIEKLKDEIERVIEQEQMFLQQDLKINDVAMRLNTNRDYIYQAINVKMGLSFSEYINRLRIGYAIQLKEKNPDLSSSDIAFRSGFSSRASFYRNFKLYQNCPPLTYRQQNQ